MGEKMNKDKLIGIATVGEKGQIVIPKNIRDKMDVKSKDDLIIIGDKEKGINIIKSEELEKIIKDKE